MDDDQQARPRRLADVYVSGPYEDDFRHWKNGDQRLKFFYGA